MEEKDDAVKNAKIVLGDFNVKVGQEGIFGPERVGNDYGIRTNRELYEVFNDMDVAKRINIQRFRPCRSEG